MKLSELRPCDKCGGPLRQGQVTGPFYVVRYSAALVNARAGNEVLGLTRMLGSLTLAEAMAAHPTAVMVFGDEAPELRTELLLCMTCYCGPVKLEELREKVEAAAERRAQEQAKPEGQPS